VRRERLLEGARRAEGVVVVIDVFRAFSLCAYAAALGARPLVAVADAREALAIKERHPDAVLSGERGGWRLEGFDLGNSPSELLRWVACGHPLRNRPFVQRTSAGTQGLLGATRARALFVAGLVNAWATAWAIRAMRARLVTVVAMGWAGQEPTEEDEACAEALQHYLTGRPWDLREAVRAMVQAPRVANLLAHELPPFWPSDVSLCLAANLFPFALRARRAGPVAVIRPVPVPAAAPAPPGRSGPPARE